VLQQQLAALQQQLAALQEKENLLLKAQHSSAAVGSSAAAPPLDLSALLSVITRIETGQQVLTAGQQTLTANQQALTAEVRALSAQAQSPSRAQDGERAWQLCPEQSTGLSPAVVEAALQRAAEHGARTSSAALCLRPIIPSDELAALRASLPKASWELELIVLVTPYLRAVAELLAAADEYVLANSEVYAWIQTPHPNRQLWQKPDLFLCHRSAYLAAAPPGQESDNAQWGRALERMKEIGAEHFLFGRAAWPLRDVVECFFEGKRQRLSLNEATGECLAKARNLLYRSAQEHTFMTPRQMVKCVLFDADEVFLLQFDSSPAGGLRSARRFGWSAPGSFVVLLDFLQAPASLTPYWLRVLRASTTHFACRLPPSNSFLGHGGMGRVFQVATSAATADQEQCRYALKVVEAGSADNRVGLLEAELEHLRRLRLQAAGTEGLALLPSSPDAEVFVFDDAAVFPPRPCGAAVRFAPIGESVALRYPKERPQRLWQEVSAALWLLHSVECYHGDARLDNLLLVPKQLPPADVPASHTRAAAAAVSAGTGNGAGGLPERVSWKLGDAQLVWIDFRESSTHPRRCALDCHTLLHSFFRLPVLLSEQRVAPLVHAYDRLWVQPAGAVATCAVADVQRLSAWQSEVWQALGSQSAAAAAAM